MITVVLATAAVFTNWYYSTMTWSIIPAKLCDWSGLITAGYSEARKTKTTFKSKFFIADKHRPPATAFQSEYFYQSFDKCVVHTVEVGVLFIVNRSGNCPFVVAAIEIIIEGRSYVCSWDSGPQVKSQSADMANFLNKCIHVLFAHALSHLATNERRRRRCWTIDLVHDHNL